MSLCAQAASSSFACYLRSWSASRSITQGRKMSDWLALDGDAARRELRQLVRVWFGLAVQEERRLAGSGPFRDEYGEARGLRTGGQDGQAAQSELVSVAIRAKEHALAPALL